MQTLAIFGAPRSGTSWLGQIFNSSPLVAYRFQPLFSYAFKGRLSESSTSADIEQFHKDLLATTDDFVLQSKSISGEYAPEFRKSAISHLVWKEVRYHYVLENLLTWSDIRIVGIVRHPCAVINSWLSAPKEFNPEWDPLTEWRYAARKNTGKREEYNGFEKWKEVVRLFIRLENKFPERIMLTRYEDINTNAEKEAVRLFSFAGLPMDDQVRDFLNKSRTTQSDDPYGVFRANKENEEWKHQLNNKIVDNILNEKEFLEINQRMLWVN